MDIPEAGTDLLAPEKGGRHLGWTVFQHSAAARAHSDGDIRWQCAGKPSAGADPRSAEESPAFKHGNEGGR